MKKIVWMILLSVILIGAFGCSKQSSEQANKSEENKNTVATSNLKTFESPDGWTIGYPSSWNRVESSFIQEEATGKTIEFHSESTTKEELEKWISSEIKRKLEATEADNVLKEDLKVKQSGPYWFYTYTIGSKIESTEHLLKNTIIFDEKKKYEFRASLPPVAEEEYDGIIKSFKLVD